MVTKRDIINWIEQNVDLVSHYNQDDTPEQLMRRWIAWEYATSLKGFHTEDLANHLLDGDIVSPIDDDFVCDFIADLERWLYVEDMLVEYFDGKLLDAEKFTTW